MILPTLGAVTFLIGAALSVDPYVWPLPKEYTISPVLDLTISTDFEFVVNGDGANSEILTDAVDRYTYITFPHRPGANESSGIRKLTIEVASDSENLQYGTDESYTLTVPNITGSNTGSLFAKTVYGAIRGLETFSQLVIYNFTLQHYQTSSCIILDEPRFKHRGLMIDTSRHFQTTESIKHVIDSMAYAKFNTLHWHLVDEQSFPYESKAYPKLWDGSYTNYERFSQNDVTDVVQHAKYHGVRVIPEFDMPGHANSWCVGYPNICPSPSCMFFLSVVACVFAKNFWF